MDAAGNVTVLYSFTGQADGGVPTGRLLLDRSGNLYGVTATGGDPNCRCGTVFVLSTTGRLTVLHQFTGGTDGALSAINRRYGLVAVGAELYGATTFGGAPDCDGVSAAARYSRLVVAKSQSCFDSTQAMSDCFHPI